MSRWPHHEDKTIYDLITNGVRQKHRTRTNTGHPTNKNSAASQQLRDQHTEEQKIYTNHININNTLKTQLLDAVEYYYVSK